MTKGIKETALYEIYATIMLGTSGARAINLF
jgi:hypothetical protein